MYSESALTLRVLKPPNSSRSSRAEPRRFAWAAPSYTEFRRTPHELKIQTLVLARICIQGNGHRWRLRHRARTGGVLFTLWSLGWIARNAVGYGIVEPDMSRVLSIRSH